MALFEYLTSRGAEAFHLIAERPEDVLIAVDFDGTLAPITTDPQRARPDPAAVAAFGRLGALVGQVAIITGRPARSCVELGGFEQVAGLDRLRIFGQYGVERWDAATGSYDIPPVPAAIRQIATELPAVVAAAGWPNARIEDKSRALAVHTRELPEPEVALAELNGPVHELAARHGLSVELGRLVLEIRASDSDKGQALNELIDEVAAKVVVFVGDDLGDLPAFKALRGLPENGPIGISVYSASEEQQTLRAWADVSCQATPGVAAWLDAVADAIEAKS